MADPVVPAKKTRDLDDDDIGILDAIKSLWKSREKPKPQEGGIGGQMRRRKIDEVVDEAITGAKDDPY
jgi:hypothetical protein